MIKSRLLRFALMAALMSSVVLAYGIGVALAQGNGFVPLAEVPAGGRLGNLYQSADLGQFINRLFTAALSLGAILAVLRLAFAGYLYMTKDSFQQKSNAKEVIGNAVLGLLLLLSIWLILRQINPQLLDLNILRHIPPLQSQTR